MCGVRPSRTYSADRQLGRRLRLLRDEGHEPRELAPREPAGVAAAEHDLAVVRDEPGERAQRRRLPGPVRADQRDPAALLGLERQAGDRLHAAEADADVAQLDHRIVLAVRRTTAKNGAPKNAVTTPIGSSAGESTVRASTSASTRKPAPTTSESGTTAR